MSNAIRLMFRTEYTDSNNRQYVSVHYWPNKDAGGAKLQEMYHKLIAARKEAAASKPASNGE